MADLASRLVRWRSPVRVLVVLGLTIAAAITAAVIGIAAGDSLDFSGAPTWGILTVGYVLVVNGYGEEIGWRGFLADTLIQRHSTGVAALVVWVVWGAWHAPLFVIVENFRDLGVGGTIGWAVGLLGGSIVLLWLYTNAERSVLVVAIWHTTFNYTAATAAAGGLIAAVSSTAVIILSIPIAARRAWWTRPTPANPSPRGDRAVIGSGSTTPPRRV